MTTTALPNRKPLRFANFDGDVTADAVGRIVGPNQLDELLIAVTAEHEDETDRTKVGYAYASIEDCLLAAADPFWRPISEQTQVAVSRKVLAHAMREKR